MTGDQARRPLRPAARDLGIGIGASAAALYLTFFATAGAVEVATLAATVAGLIWFATVEPRRLLDERGRPHLTLFVLAGAAMALVLATTLVLRTGTLFLSLGVAVGAVTSGLWRAVVAGYHPGG